MIDNDCFQKLFDYLIQIDNNSLRCYKDVNLNNNLIDAIVTIKDIGIIILSKVTQSDFLKKSIKANNFFSDLYLNKKQIKYIRNIIFSEEDLSYLFINLNPEYKNNISYRFGNIIRVFDLFKEQLIQDNHITPYTNIEDEYFKNYKINNIKKEINTLIEKFTSYYFISHINNKLYIKLSEKQKRIINNESIKRRRVTGPAGCGKSLICALSAAKQLLTDKKVLVITYNITLVNHLRELVNTGLNNPSFLNVGKNPSDKTNYKEHLNIKHFHGFCSEIKNSHRSIYCMLCNNFENDNLSYRTKPVIDLTEEDFKNWTLMLNSVLSNSNLYDYIIVDEGQDFECYWLNFLVTFLKKDGFFLLFADGMQNIYERKYDLKSLNSTHFKGLGFSGPWLILNGSYRIPASISKLCTDFINFFVKNDTESAEYSLNPDVISDKQISLFGNCYIQWFSYVIRQDQIIFPVRKFDESIYFFVLHKINFLIYKQKLSLQNITILCTFKSFGRELVDFLEHHEIQTESVFDKDWQSNHEEKLNFGSTENALKCSTIESYKGWESDAIILLNVHNRLYSIDKAEDSKKGTRYYHQNYTEVTDTKNDSILFSQLNDSSFRKFYVALSRIKETNNLSNYLIILNEYEEYEKFAEYEKNKLSQFEYFNQNNDDNNNIDVIFYDDEA